MTELENKNKQDNFDTSFNYLQSQHRDIMDIMGVDRDETSTLEKMSPQHGQPQLDIYLDPKDFLSISNKLKSMGNYFEKISNAWKQLSHTNDKNKEALQNIHMKNKIKEKCHKVEVKNCEIIKNKEVSKINTQFNQIKNNYLSYIRENEKDQIIKKETDKDIIRQRNLEIEHLKETVHNQKIKIRELSSDLAKYTYSKQTTRELQGTKSTFDKAASIAKEFIALKNNYNKKDKDAHFRQMHLRIVDMFRDYVKNIVMAQNSQLYKDLELDKFIEKLREDVGATVENIQHYYIPNEKVVQEMKGLEVKPKLVRPKSTESIIPRHDSTTFNEDLTKSDYGKIFTRDGQKHKKYLDKEKEEGIKNNLIWYNDSVVGQTKYKNKNEEEDLNPLFMMEMELKDQPGPLDKFFIDSDKFHQYNIEVDNWIKQYDLKKVKRGAGAASATEYDPKNQYYKFMKNSLGVFQKEDWRNDPKISGSLPKNSSDMSEEKQDMLKKSYNEKNKTSFHDKAKGLIENDPAMMAKLNRDSIPSLNDQKEVSIGLGDLVGHFKK